MNERIQELAEQCKETYTTYFDGRGNVTETNFNQEKFAELIVRECMQEISDLMDYTDYPDEPEKSTVELKTLREARQVIKQHFGVEE